MRVRPPQLTVLLLRRARQARAALEGGLVRARVRVLGMGTGSRLGLG